jgi:AcrR family transcriptional regulator
VRDAVESRQVTSDDRRGTIIAAASRVVAARGVDDTRLADVAREGGVSIGLLQHYFGNREELLAQTFDALLAADLASWESLAGLEGDPARRLDLLLRLSSDGRWPDGIGDESPTSAFRVWIEHWAMAGRNPALRARSGAIYDAWSEAVRETIARGLASGAFRPIAPVEDVVRRVVACADGLAVRVVLGHLDPDEMYRLLRGLADVELGAASEGGARAGGYE